MALNDYSGVKLSRSMPMVKRILALTFPEYSGRTIKARAWTRPQRLENYWDGGSRSFWRMLDLASGKVGEPTNGNPLRSDAHVEFDLPDGWAAVEHSIFCGKDMGITIWVRAPQLPMIEG